ncbi:MAG: GNAT family N-acetyltransferase [Anaerolineae bacterium]|nr:GNAT family N-acetyltransferase [Anaerolineae bacterium]
MLGNQLLQGEKVYLNAITREDIPQFGRWFGNLELLSYLWTDAVFPQTQEDETDWYERMRKSDDYDFAIRALDHNQLIGSISIKAPDWKNRSAVFGIAIGDPNYWGQGYGTDATRVILRYAFLELNLHRVELYVYNTNPRAIKSYEKVGFQLEGVKRQAAFRDGQYFDIHIMGILRDEWQALNP